MSIDTYAKLQASVGSWLHRSDLAARAPDFISLAEARFNRNLRARQMQKAFSQLIASPVVTLPTDWLETVDRPKVEDEPLDLVTRAQFEERQVRGWFGCYYTIWGNEIRIGMRIQDPVTVTFDYYGRIPALSTQAPVNWLLRDGQDIYLYGSLLEAAPYLNNDARIETWRALLQVGLTDLQTSNDNAKFAGGTLAMGQAT